MLCIERYCFSSGVGGASVWEEAETTLEHLRRAPSVTATPMQPGSCILTQLPSHTPHPKTQPVFWRTRAFGASGLSMPGKMVTLYGIPRHRKTKASVAVLFFSINLSPPQILYILLSPYIVSFIICLFFFSLSHASLRTRFIFELLIFNYHCSL